MRVLSFLLTLTCLFSACTGPLAPDPTLVATATSYPTPESLFTSSGGGEPRTPGYWLLWNSCAPDNQAETARANGGRAAGWIVMDDLLADPGILVGVSSVESCTQGVSLLQGRDLQGVDRQIDAAYALATQLLAAQLNLASGSEYCAASDQAVQAAQLLLAGLDFDGTKGYLGPPMATQDVLTARVLTEQLADYNAGALCIQ